MRCFSVVVAAVALAVSTGCAGSAASGDGRLQVEAAFYPLQFLVSSIGGPDVEVHSLTKAGAEPHDVELSPRQVAAMGKADLVVLLSGFQPAVDEAAEQGDAPVLDVARVQPLEKGFVPLDQGALADDRTGPDPHVWLDPQRFSAIADAVTARLAELAPDKAAAFRARARDLTGRLAQLDRDFRAGLASCRRKELVTSHNAFGYLARAYGLEQVGITGLTPEAEPSPGRLAEVARLAKDKGVTTVFFEDLVSPKTAESLAREVGARAEVLSPLESAPDKGDYLTQMRLNLAALREALACR